MAEFLEWVDYEMTLSRYHKDGKEDCAEGGMRNFSKACGWKFATSYSVDEWFAELEKGWELEERNRASEGRSFKSTLQTGLERFLGIDIALEKKSMSL